LAQLLSLLPTLEHDASTGGKRKNILLQILRSFRELSKDSNCIGPLIEAKTMSTVIPFLKSKVWEIQYIVVEFLWYMTRVNNKYSIQARREAAENGAIPVVKRLLKYDKKFQNTFYLVDRFADFQITQTRRRCLR